MALDGQEEWFHRVPRAAVLYISNYLSTYFLQGCPCVAVTMSFSPDITSVAKAVYRLIVHKTLEEGCKKKRKNTYAATSRAASRAEEHQWRCRCWHNGKLGSIAPAKTCPVAHARETGLICAGASGDNSC